jgi:WD40 repeat protein
LELPIGSLASLAFSPDSKALVTAGRNDTVLVWDIQTGRGRGLPATLFFREDQTVLPRWKEVYSVAFAPDGKTLAVAAKPYERPRVAPLSEPLPKKEAAKWEQVKKRAVTLWDPESLEERAVIDLPPMTDPFVRQLAYTPDGKILLMLTQYHLVVWDTETKQKLHVVTITNNGENLPALSVSPDGKKVAVGGQRCRAITVLDLTKLIENKSK